MPCKALKLYLTEGHYNSSIMEWKKKAENKKWYHVTEDAFINYFYEMILNIKLISFFSFFCVILNVKR